MSQQTASRSTQQDPGLPIASVQAAQGDSSESQSSLASGNPEPQPVDNNQINWGAPSPTSSPVEQRPNDFGEELTSIIDTSNGLVNTMLSFQGLDDTNGSPTVSESSQTLPEHRTGLVRPTAPSTWERPPDPKSTIQPGIITASIFGLLAFIALGLYLSRRWRRKRTRQRTRSIINLLDRVREKQTGLGIDGSPEKTRTSGPTLDVADAEAGVIQSDTSNAYGTGRSSAVMQVPLPARLHSEVVGEIHDGPLATVEAQSTPFKLTGTHMPARPSPLRTVD
ncbi:hypothetical protein FRC17_009211 [Serendipita sp. 399]|nr:hypothetical protein FRC17_009211 [Serendipita sp. 399]